MKIANALLLITVTALTVALLVQHHAMEVVKEARASAQQETDEARAKANSLSADAEKTAVEVARMKEQQAELIKLRGEVTALRREKEDLTKKLAAAETAAKRLESMQAERATAPNATSPEPNPGTLANEAGRLRRKALSGERLSDAEMAFLVSLKPKVSEIEKTPETFADFQSAQLAALFGWSNADPRLDQVKTVLNAASKAANARGLTFNAPGQSYETWDADHKTLDTRATGAVKKILTPDEQAAFDTVFQGIMNADVLAAPRK